jgi:signal transduction histidine kinase
MSHFPDYFRIASNYEFLSYVADSYYFAVILLFLNGLYYLGTQSWLKLSWMLLFFFGYLLLVNVSLLGGVARFYVELQYQPLAFFIAIPFAIDVLPAMRLRRTAIVLLALLFASRLALIVYHSVPYRERLGWHRAMIERLSLREGNRYLIEESDAPVKKLILTWGSSYESLLVSSIEGPKKSITYQIDEEPERFKVFKDNENVFHTEWKTFPSSDLPARYFALEPHRYEKLTNEDIVP